jgi:flagellar basal-body rod protein FlgB
VQILDSLFGPQVNNLNRALDKASQRQGLLNANLANVNTPGYKRRDMDFSIALDGASKSQDKLGVSRSDEDSVRIDGNSVDLEQEVMAITETEYRYQMLAEMTSGYFSGLKNVIREGR